MERWIMHVDMDAFFASVEQHDHPEYRGKPVIVGGLSGRGVVATASYEARRFGVHSAMSMARAHQLCPDAVYLPTRFERYRAVSEEIRAIFRQFSPCVEPISIDEAFLDVSGMEKLMGRVTDLGPKIKKAILEKTGLTASVGLAPNKFLAKLASDMEKPDGYTIIYPETAAEQIAPLPIGRIFGVGAKTASALHRLGIDTIGQLAACPPAYIRPIAGKNTDTLLRFARGLDDRPVVPDEKRQSLGREETFEEDLLTKKDCLEALWELTQEVGWRLRSSKLSGTTVTLKIKTADFKLHTRSQTSEFPVSLDEEIMDIIIKLADGCTWKDPVRLLGVTVSHLTPAEDTGFDFSGETAKARKRSTVLDALKQRFGEDIIHKGSRKP
jgi:DNA polymerase-4